MMTFSTKCSLLLCLVLGSWLSSATPAFSQEFHPTRLVVKYKQQQPATALLLKAGQLHAAKMQPLVQAKLLRAKPAAEDLVKTYVITFADSLSRRQAEQTLSSDPSVANVERDYRIELFHDPLYSYQWALENDGQQYPGVVRFPGNNNDSLKMLSGTPGADIKRYAVSDIPTDHSRVKIAIIDTGVDYTHPDIAANIWKNPAEASGLPGRDDDLNGYVDDIMGYDFSGDNTDVLNIIPDPDPLDTIGHGTHVAGIVGAVTGNGIGIEGVAPNVSIMCVKIFPNAFTSVSSQAIIYAVDEGAKVINASWGSPYYSTVLNDAIAYAQENGVLFVAAAGNSGDSSPFYPAVVPGVLTVGACNSSGQASYFSTFGDWVDLSAPGQDILSLRAKNTDLYAEAGEPKVHIFDNNYYLADGTSMAAPHVTGAAAFLLSSSPGLTSDSVKSLLIATADQITDPNGNPQGNYSVYSGYGRINLERAAGVLSGDYAEISAPVSRSINSGVISISGSAFSNSGEPFVLEAHPASANTWLTIATGTANQVNEVLAQWDSSPYDGDTELRLRVGDGITYRTTIRLVNNIVVDILNPQDGDTVRGAVEIVGTASAPNFASYDLEYYPSINPKQPVLIRHGTIPVFSQTLVNWSVGPVRSGSGILKLQLSAGGQVYNKTVPIVIKTLLDDNYPITPATRPHYMTKPADLNGDGEVDLVTGGQNGVIINHYATRELDVLNPGVGGIYQSAPAVYDFDGDGRDELVVVSDSGMTIMHGDGTNLPGWPQRFPTGFEFTSVPTPLVSDIDGDGDPEISLINAAGQFYCFRSDGSGYFHSHGGLFASLNHTGLPRLFGQSVPASVFAYDFNHDGYRDLGTLYALQAGDGGVYLFSGKNGLPLYPAPGARVRSMYAPFGAVLADFDNDGEPEIAFAYYRDDLSIAVTIIEANGQDLPGWPRYFPDKIQYLTYYPAAGDLDGDSIPELVMTFSAPLDGGELYIWHADGTPWLDSELGRHDGFVAGVGNALASPIIVDTDNDGAYEIVARGGATFFGKPEKIFSFELDGSQTPGWPLYTFADPGMVLYSPNTPIAGDFDKDGLLELYMGASDQKMYAWDLPTVASDSAILWNGFLNDPQNSGILPFASRSAPPPPKPPLPTSFRLAQNYPNPFNATTVIEFDLATSEAARLEVFNVLGQKVTTIVDRTLPAGFYRYEWDATNSTGEPVASGVYYYRLKFGHSSETKAMVLLK